MAGIPGRNLLKNSGKHLFSNTSSFQVPVTSLVPYFRAFKPHNFCNKEETTLLHYVKNENQKIYMDNFKSYGLFCDDDWVVEHKKP